LRKKRGSGVFKPCNLHYIAIFVPRVPERGLAMVSGRDDYLHPERKRRPGLTRRKLKRHKESYLGDKRIPQPRKDVGKVKA